MANNDEFYTQYAHIQKEVNAYLEYNPDTFRDKTVLLPCDDPGWSNFTRFFAQNFERLGLKRLISKKEERDMADIIIAAPPSSLFRELLDGSVKADKGILILGKAEAMKDREVFSLIMNDKLWLGPSNCSGDPDSVRWFTNLEHGRRHEPLRLMSQKDNIRFSKHKEIRETGYVKYENYDAIEIPFSDAIPSDYDGIMGVPITFLDKYCPEQFRILGMCENQDLYGLKTRVFTPQECRDAYFYKFGRRGIYDLNASGVLKTEEGLFERVDPRILIQRA